MFTDPLLRPHNPGGAVGRFWEKSVGFVPMWITFFRPFGQYYRCPAGVFDF